MICDPSDRKNGYTTHVNFRHCEGGGGTYTETSEKDVEFWGVGETIWELGRRWGGGVLVMGGPVEETESDCTIMTLLVQRIVRW